MEIAPPQGVGRPVGRELFATLTRLRSTIRPSLRRWRLNRERPISLLNQDGQRVGLLHARGGGQRAARRG
ncbi:hypothetical protein, partial [Rubneribacter badeniensis]|uniref:hypothetical protein n=1 Tax=Rubneribacter badeniensis TaxID=2070688 RepID=UPI003A9332CE